MLTGLLAGAAIVKGVSGGVDVPPLDREFRGAWVATVANIDWPSRRNLTVAEMKAELLAILDKLSSLNMNAMVLQVRPTGDALYQSDLEPWSHYLTGTQGVAPPEGFDPLAFAVEEAHRRGIEVHAWCNPFRAASTGFSGPFAPNHIAVRHPGVVKEYGGQLWMDPGEPLVQEHSLAVFLDIATRYDIDGLHIDDYFYPYPVYEDGQRVEFPDDGSYARYRAIGGAVDRDAWRRANVNRFVHQAYHRLKQVRPTVKFGISPFGIYRPGIPAGIQGFDQYAEIYADARAWWRAGLCDYWSPQLYWPIGQAAQSYATLLPYWAGENLKGRHYWPGNFTSRTNPADGDWPASEIVNQVLLTQREQGASGNLHFSMKALMRDWNGVSTALGGQVYLKRTVVPASPWLDGVKPSSPTISVQEGAGSTAVTIQSAGGEDIRFFAYQSSAGHLTVTAEGSVVWPTAGLDWVAVRSIDKAGNEGPVRLMQL